MQFVLTYARISTPDSCIGRPHLLHTRTPRLLGVEERVWYSVEDVPRSVAGASLSCVTILYICCLFDVGSSGPTTGERMASEGLS